MGESIKVSGGGGNVSVCAHDGDGVCVCVCVCAGVCSGGERACTTLLSRQDIAVCSGGECVPARAFVC